MVDTDRAGLLEKLANVEQFPVSVNSIMRIRDSYWKKIFFQVKKKKFPKDDLRKVL